MESNKKRTAHFKSALAAWFFLPIICIAPICTTVQANEYNHISGTNSADQISGTGVADAIWGYNGADEISGAEGGDYIDGGQGNDILQGEAGEDYFPGDEGDDYIYGGPGNDSLRGGLGNDTLQGGTGGDHYVFAPGDGQDTINNGDSDGVDVLFFEDSITSDTLNYFRVGDNLEIRVAGSTDKVTVVNWFLSQNYEIDYLSGGESNAAIPAAYVSSQAVVDNSGGGDNGGGDQNQSPVANAGSDQAVYVGEIVILDPRGSTDPDGDAINFAWTLLNGSGITLGSGPEANTAQFTAPIVNQATNLVFQLTVTDAENNASTDQVVVTVSPEPGPNQAPIIDAGSDQSVLSGDQVTIDMSNSYDPDGTPLNSVQIGLSATRFVSIQGQMSYSPPKYVFTAPEVSAETIVTLTFTFIDDQGAQGSDSVNVTINPSNGNQTPIANAGDDQTVSSGNPVLINGNQSYDPDGDALTLEWSVVSGPVVELTEARILNSYVFVAPQVSEPTVIEFSLQATDTGGLSNQDILRITVKPAEHINQIPVANAGADITVTSGRKVVLDGRNSFDPDYEAISLNWSVDGDAFELIDGSIANTVEFTAPDMNVPTSYFVRLRVADPSGATNEDTVLITINPDRNPTAAAGRDQWVTKGSKVILDARSSSDPNGQALTYSWQEQSTDDLVISPFTIHGVYEFIAPDVTENKIYNLELTVTTTDGRSETDVIAINVSPEQVSMLDQKPIANAGTDIVVGNGERVRIDYSQSYDPDNSFLRSSWSFPGGFSNHDFMDGQILEIDAPTVEHTSIFIFTLTVTDSIGQTDTDIVRVTVTGTSGETLNSAPQANAGLDQTVNIGELVVLDASETADPEYDDFAVSWSSITDTSIDLTINQNTSIVSFIAPEQQYTKDLTFKMTAVDSEGNESSDEVTVKVLGREALPSSNIPSADVVVVMDESGSMTGEQLWISETIRPLHDSLVARGIGSKAMENRYGLVGFGPNAYSVKTISVGGQQYGSAHEFISATETLQAEGGLEDGWLAVSHALNTYHHRGASALNIILVTDEDRDEADASVNYDNTLASLKAHNALLNAVVKAKFYCGDGREAIGMDASGLGYLANGQGGFETCSNARVENYSDDANAATTVEDYVNLAIASGGAAWDVMALRFGGYFAQSFTQAIIDIKTQEISSQLPQGKYQAIIDAHPKPAQVNEIISLDASRSKAVEGELAITQYEWDLDNNGSFETQGVNASVSFPQMGTYPVRLRVSHNGQGINSDIVTVDLIVADADLINRSAVITSEPVTHVLDTQSYSYHITAQDQHSDVTYQLISQIDGMVIDAITGEVTWDEPVEGEHEVRVQAVDDEGLSDIQIYTLYVIHENRSAIITSNPQVDAFENKLYTYQVFAWDPESENMFYELITSPENMSIDSNTGEIVWLPTINDIGGHTINIKVSDPWNKSNIQSFTLMVDNVNDRPEINSQPITTATEDLPYQYDASVHDLDIGIDNDEQHSYVLTLSPEGMAIDSVSGRITWVPTNAQVGNSTVTLKVTDNDGLTDTQTFTVSVINVNDKPTIDSDPVVSVDERGNYVYQVEGNDQDNGDHIQYKLVAGPEGLVMDDNGRISWLPTAENIGDHVVTVSVIDSTGEETIQSFTLTVNNTLDAPVITSTALTSINERETYSYDVESMDYDVGDVITYSLISSPSGMSVDPATGLIQWTPQKEFIGNHNIVVEAKDQAGLSDQQAFTLQVIDVNEQPSIVSDPVISADENANYIYEVKAEDPDITGYLRYKLTKSPWGMEINANTGFIYWKPSVSQVGAHEVTIKVEDQGGLFDEQTYQLTVNDLGNAPYFITTAPTSFYVGDTYYFYEAKATDKDPDETLTYSLLTFPDNMSINKSTGSIIWMPSSNQQGQNYVSIQVEDSTGLTTVQNFNIKVYGSVSANDATYSTDENTALDVELVATDAIGDLLTYKISRLPENGTIVGEGQNIIYLPNEHFEGQDTFEFTAANSYQDNATGVVTIDIIPKNDPPKILSKPNTKHVLGQGFGPAQPMIATDWEDVGLDSASNANWQFEDEGLTTRQTAHPNAVGLVSDFDMANSMIEGTFEVESTGDDDWIGFLIGYQNKQQHYLLDWKQNYQGSAVRGIAFRKYDNPIENGVVTGQYWNNVSDSTFERLYYNDVARQDLVEYKLQLSFINGTITADITNGVELVDSITVNDSTFTDGRFGFYMQSQERGVFSNFAISYFGDNSTYSYNVRAMDPEGGVLTYSLKQAPEGMQIDSATGKITYTTSKELAGTYTVEVEVADDQGQTDTQVFDLVVTDEMPIIMNKPLNVANVDRLYEYKVNAFDPNVNETLEYRLLNAPEGMSVDKLTGLVSWVPALQDVGEHAINLEVFDPKGNFDRIEYTLNVSEQASNTLPEITSIPVTEAKVGRHYSYELHAIDADGDALQYVMGDYVPQGMQMFDGKTVTWTPRSNQVQAHEVTFIALDSKGGATEQVVVINVTDLADNTAPTITSSPIVDVFDGAEYQYQVQATDPENNAISFILLKRPIGMTIDKSTGLIKWTASTMQGEFAEVEVQATDEHGAKDVQSFTLSIKQPQTNYPPSVTSNPTAVATVGTEYTYQVIATDPENEAISYELASSSSGMSIDSNGLFTWTPTADQLGDHEVVILVKDTYGYALRQSFILKATDTNAAPQLTAAVPTSVFADSEWRHQFIATDVDGDTLTWGLTGAIGDMAISESGELNWTPDVTLINQQVTFSVWVHDGRGLQSTAEITVTVQEDLGNVGNPGDPDHQAQPNTNPQLGALNAPYAYINLPWTFQVEATDADNDTLTFSLMGAVDGMSISSTGYFTWTPSSDWADKSVTFGISVSDGKGGHDGTFLTVPVNYRDNAAPSIQSAPTLHAKLGETYRYDIIATDIENDLVSFELDQAPQGTQLSVDGELTWDAMNTGSYDFAVWVKDGENEVLHTWKVLVVDGNGTLFITSSPEKRAKTEELYQYQLEVINIGNHPVTYSLVGGPAGMTINDSGLLTYQATTNLLGISQIQIKVENDQVDSAEQDFNLLITAPGPYSRRLCQ